MSVALLVVRPSSLGDIVHALALVADVTRARPDATIDWVVEPAFAELPALCPDVRRVVPFALRRWRRALLDHATWREIAAFRRSVREQRYDAILDLQEQVKGGVVARTARGVRHGFDRDSIREKAATLFDDVHHAVPREAHFATRCRMLAAAALGYTLDGSPTWCFVSPATVDAMPAGRYAVVVHATSRADKLWPEERWRDLVGGFAHAGLRTLLPWGNEAERERSGRIAHGIDQTVVPTRQSLTALAALLAKAEVVVGVDTGLTHLAAALGAPTVAIFTQTDAARAGVGIAGAHARDVGGRGHVPSLDEVQALVGQLQRATPRC